MKVIGVPIVALLVAAAPGCGSSPIANGGTPGTDAAGADGPASGADAHGDAAGSCSEEKRDVGTQACNPCHCVDGQIVCTDVVCPPDDGQGCDYNGLHYLSGTSFPASDGCNTCGCRNGQVTCTARACGLPDGGRDAPPVCSLEQRLTFGRRGGFISFTDESELFGDGTLRIRRDFTARSGRDGPVECSSLLECGALADVRAALANPDVRNALELATPPRYGMPEPDAGEWFLLTEAGRGFELLPAGTRPAGLLALEARLDNLYSTVVQSDACKNLGN